MRALGRHGSPWTPDTARAEALRLLGLLVGGNDPFAQSLNAESFGATVKRYLDHKRQQVRPLTFDQIQLHLLRKAAPLAGVRLGDIDRRKIATLLSEANGPVARNRFRSSLSAFFGWCIAEGLLDTNPVEGTAKFSEGGGRERVLTPDEIGELWAALGDGRYPDVLRLLLLTGQRRGEIGQLRWSEVNFAEKAIVLPAARTKNGREHFIPLSAQALSVLRRQPRPSEFVFAGTRGFVKWTHYKSALDARLKLKAWRIHDLRRTAATGMAELGVQPHIIEAVLNHVSGHKAGVAGIYNRARYEADMRVALQRWADHLDQITGATK